ncbi:MAG: type II toxin-antitoxin system VapC family toxin [Acidobacteriota bacterium]
MIGLDTNVLVRHIVQDDEKQARSASRLIESRCTADDPGVVCLTVVCELACVLDRGYGYDRPTVAGVLRRLLTAEDLRVERAELAFQALNLYQEGSADFADYLIGLNHREQGAEATFTFGRRAAGCRLFQLLG